MRSNDIRRNSSKPLAFRIGDSDGLKWISNVIRESFESVAGSRPCFDILRLFSWRLFRRSSCGITFMRVLLDVHCTLFDILLKSSDSMFTSAKIRNGSTYLDNHLSANDYYAQGERVTGEWLGKGAESLGLSGEVRPEAFEALRVNQRPGTGNRLPREPRRRASPPWLRPPRHSGKRKAAQAQRRRSPIFGSP